jgi:hypothetical protein
VFPPLIAEAEPVLLGVATSYADAVPVRTAVLGRPGLEPGRIGDELYFAKEGELVELRFQVVRIEAEAVELFDTASRATRRLALK